MIQNQLERLQELGRERLLSVEEVSILVKLLQADKQLRDKGKRTPKPLDPLTEEEALAFAPRHVPTPR